jgi:Fe-S cluster assembly protein SufD
MSLASAIATGDLNELPSRRQEDWRWTDLHGLLRTLPAAPGPFEGHLPDGPFEAAEEELLIVNGDGPVRLMVAAGERRVVALRIVSAGPAGAWAARLSVNIEKGGTVVLLQSHEAVADGHVSEFDLDMTLGAEARVERVVMMSDQSQSITISDAQINLAPGASYDQTILTHGGRRQRVETRLVNPGGGATVRLDGVYLVGETRHADVTTEVTHTGLDGFTSQLTKGVARDRGRATFQGRIIVREGADRTDARMGHHALVLSERAEVNAKPELEIYADDVSCAHGNTVGALDEEAIFYACQRGIPESEARALLTMAFVGEVIDRIEYEPAADVARSWLELSAQASTT